MASKRNGRTFREDISHHIPADGAHSQSRHPRVDDSPYAAERHSSSGASSRRDSRASLNHDINSDLSSEKTMLDSRDDESRPPPATGRELKTGRQLPTMGDVFAALSTAPSNPSSSPAVPLEGRRPSNFGVVVPGVYRSSYPQPENFGFMRDLGLKTVVTLGRPDEPDRVYYDFLAANSSRHQIIDMKGTKKESIPLRTMREILSIVLDRQNHPLMIHCNHGKHRTGCVVAVIRKVYGWELNTILDEYRSYATPKVRECDVAYITDFNVRDLSNLFIRYQKTQARIRTKLFWRATIFAFVVLTLWCISGSRISYAARSPQAAPR